MLALIWPLIAEEELEAHRVFRSDFEARIDGRWCEGTDLLELLRHRGIDAAEAAIEAQSKVERTEREDLLFGLLVRLHARSALIVSEILALLRTGHADGAMGRWRTLYEVAVVMHFIADHGPDVAERYIDYMDVRTYKAALQHNQFADRLGSTPLDDDEIAELTVARNEVVARYGKAFGGEYGWAATALGLDRVRFVDIEKSTNFDHTRPWYRLASESQHAGPHSIFYSLATDLHGDALMLAGASDAGLETPGGYAALTFAMSCGVVLRLDSTYESVVNQVALHQLALSAEAAFNAAATQLEREARERQDEVT